MSNRSLKLRTLAGLAVLAVHLAQASALYLEQSFAADPATQGWFATGQSSLFRWNAANQNLDVTWDSSKTNSYFCLPLGRTLERPDSFTVDFDLRLSDFVAGVDPQKPNPFQLSVGLINLAQATSPGFHRGSGFESPNLVEFSFFPDPGGPWLWGPSLTASLIDWTGTNWNNGGFAPESLPSNEWIHITLNYSGRNETLTTTVSVGGTPVATLSAARLATNFLDFQVDHVAVASYSDAGQEPFYAGSILAHGAIDNVVVTAQSPAIGPFTGSLTNGVWQAHIHGRANWLYTLECSTNLTQWMAVPGLLQGQGAPLTLLDTNPPSPNAVYRVRGDKQ